MSIHLGGFFYYVLTQLLNSIIPLHNLSERGPTFFFVLHIWILCTFVV
jgi:hypothetical protein